MKKLILTATLTFALLLTACGNPIAPDQTKDSVGDEILAETDTEADEDGVASATERNNRTTEANGSTERESAGADTTSTTVANTTATSTTATTATNTNNNNRAAAQPQTSVPATQTSVPTATEHVHNWVKVVDTSAWDEYTEVPVYEEQQVIVDKHYWMRNGMDIAHWPLSEKNAWCQQHCDFCYPDCPDPMYVDGHRVCAFEVKIEPIYETQTIQVGTEKVVSAHHDEVFHYECSCGATK